MSNKDPYFSDWESMGLTAFGPKSAWQRVLAGGGGMSYAYEAAKQAWVRAHPGATPEQYERAMRAICRRLGI